MFCWFVKDLWKLNILSFPLLPKPMVYSFNCVYTMCKDFICIMGACGGGNSEHCSPYDLLSYLSNIVHKVRYS